MSLVALYDRLYPLIWSVLSWSFHSDRCLTPTQMTKLHQHFLSLLKLTAFKLKAVLYIFSTSKKHAVFKDKKYKKMKIFSALRKDEGCF
jgi:hypothetical protein